MPHDDGPAAAGDFEPASFARWKALVEEGLKGVPFDKKLVTRSVEGVAVQPLYTADDWQGEAGYPGLAPYRRGSDALGHAGGRWCMRQAIDHPDPAAARQDLAEEQARGVRSLWLRADRSARLGDPAQAAGDGAVVATAAQLGELLQGADLGQVEVVLDAGANALPAFALLSAAAEARSVAPRGLHAELGADPLGALARDGALPCSLAAARTQLVELVRHAEAVCPDVTVATVSTLPYHDAGAHAAQELSYALATAVTYLRWLTDGDVPLPAAARQLTFTVPVGSDFFMEMAKLRALRQCYARVLQASGLADAPPARIHAVTSSRSKTARDPWVNMLRETTEAFAAAVAGADAITTAGFDRTLGASDAFARRIARNTQVILDEESHVTKVADAGGGSWYLESLTDTLAQKAWAGLQEIEREGGMERALSEGRVASDIAAVAAERSALIAKRKQAITGVSEFANVAEEAVERVQRDPAVTRRALEAAGGGDAEGPALAVLRDARVGALVEATLSAARAGHGVTELSAALAGSDAPARIEPLPVRRHAADYERLRDACDRALKDSGARPSVFLCNLGPIPEHKARASFATGFLNAGGLAVVDNDGFADRDAAVAAFKASGARAAVLCGPDGAYPEWVPGLVPALRDAGAVEVLLAGRGGDHEAAFREAGVSTFIYMGCDVVATLTTVLAALGVKP